jgi:hypothetical protein
MVPNTRSQSSAADATVAAEASSQELQDSSSSEPASDSELSDSEDDSSSTVRSPTKLRYRLDKLPERLRESVRDAFGDPPKLAMQRRRLVDNTYAFQMTELVTRSVRIRGDPDGASSSRLTCSCGGGADEDAAGSSCPHLLWLLDQLLKQTLYTQDHNTPVTMSANGWAEEMGDPFRTIAAHHLEVLAPSLHCQIVDPDADSDHNIDPTRVLESRELLAHVHSTAPEDFRPDIFDHPTLGKKTLKKNDLDCSVFRMLMDNPHFFQYFLSLSQPTDPIKDPFRKLSQRVDRVLRRLDSNKLPQSSAAQSNPETPQNVTWAAKHLRGSVGLIKASIFATNRPLQSIEAMSAARALVHILDEVVHRNYDIGRGATRVDRNLYLQLIGDRDEDFVIDVLNILPEAASQFLHDLEDVLDQIGVHGAPASYVAKFRSLLKRLRSSSTGSALKRQVPVQTTDRRSKRSRANIS